MQQSSSGTVKSTVQASASSSPDQSSKVAADTIPSIPQRIRERLLQYQNIRSVNFIDWLPSAAGMYITTRFGQTWQAHRVDQPLGMRRQLTFFDDPVYVVAPCPDTSVHGFLFLKDRNGSEFNQIYFYNGDDGKSTLLTDGVSKNDNILWSNKGDIFVYTSTKRNGRDTDLYVQKHQRGGGDTVVGGELLLQLSGAWAPLRWSHDDTRLVMERYVSAQESYLFILDFRTGECQQILASKEQIAYGDVVWDRNDTGLYFTSDQRSQFLSLWHFDFASKTMMPLASEISWNIMELKLSPDGAILAFTTNEHGNGSLYLLDTKTGQAKRVPNLPVGRIYGVHFHPSNGNIAFVISSTQISGDVFELDRKSRELRRWTQSENGGLNPDKFTDAIIIDYPTFDSVGGKPRLIPAFYFKPRQRLNQQKPTAPTSQSGRRGEGAPKAFPVLIKIHGGPESQYWPTFDPTTQYCVNELGIAVLAPNVRGSAGYGKEYLSLDNGYNRLNSLKDIGALLDWIQRQPELDKSRVAVFGGSYGGFLSLATLAAYGKRLRCGVDIYGITDFVTFLKNTQPYRQELRRVEYGDERDSAMASFLHAISPLTNCSKITKPLFVVQGANDPRVPLSESEQMVSAIRKNKGVVWYLPMDDEGHGFGKKSNIDSYENVLMLFLETYLLP
ncbi:MAG: S9 family peptidase [Chitinivibrionales bacterium]|nr:S9 family peptidase [Chitinivibrionales bacterium]